MMNTFHEVYFLILAFLAELLGTLSGVSSSTLFVPLGQLLESLQVTLALTATLHVFGNAIRTILYRQHLDWPLVFKFGLPSLFCTGVGAQYSDSFSSRIYSVILGLFLISLSTYFLFFETKYTLNGKWVPYLGGAVSGLLTGLIGSGGAVRSLALASFNLNPLVFIATSTLIDFGGDIFRLIIYLKKGYLNQEHYFYIPFLILVAYFANMLAKRWIKVIPKARFKKIILSFVFMMGWALILIHF